jgi:hypothetical protein
MALITDCEQCDGQRALYRTHVDSPISKRTRDFYQICNRGSRLSEDAKEFSKTSKMYIASWADSSAIH